MGHLPPEGGGRPELLGKPPPSHPTTKKRCHEDRWPLQAMAPVSDTPHAAADGPAAHHCRRQLPVEGPLERLAWQELHSPLLEGGLNVSSIATR